MAPQGGRKALNAARREKAVYSRADPASQPGPRAPRRANHHLTAFAVGAPRRANHHLTAFAVGAREGRDFRFRRRGKTARPSPWPKP